MGARYLIDSNVLIDYLIGKLPASGAELLKLIVDDTPILSFITKIEVLSHNNDEASETLLLEFISCSVVITISSEIITATINIRKERKLKLPDAIIAATALT